MKFCLEDLHEISVTICEFVKIVMTLRSAKFVKLGAVKGKIYS
jgi:hypothetical protein